MVALVILLEGSIKTVGVKKVGYLFELKFRKHITAFRKTYVEYACY